MNAINQPGGIRMCDVPINRSKRPLSIFRLIIILCLSSLFPAQSLPSATPKTGQSGASPSFDLSKIIAEKLNAFAKEDAENPSQSGGIIFAGSSIFDQWSNLKSQMAPLPVLNRAISGTKTYQQLANIDQLVLKYRPKIIVYYCGSNDVSEGSTAAAIIENFKKFVDRVAAELPDTKIVFASINRAPQKKALWNIVDEANSGIKSYAEKNSRVVYVELNAALFDEKGEPRLELYQNDRLHFKAPAYEEFTRIIKPVLQQLWKK
jgi:lysophospholipase L1-like esterase